MSEFLTIDTTQGIFKEERIEPLALYDEYHPALKMKLEEYNTPLPNTPLETLIKRMVMTMKLYGGIGLSANQCGILHRVFVIGIEDYQIACINPKVIEVSTETEIADEGCLSFPGLLLKVERPKWILAEYTNPDGEIVRQKFEGITARCYLHELDHMNGIVYTTRCKPLALKSGLKKVEKFYRKYFNPKTMKQLIANGNQKTNP